MGEDNVAEFGAAIEGEAALRPLLEQWRPSMILKVMGRASANDTASRQIHPPEQRLEPRLSMQ